MKYAITLALLLTGCGLMETLDDTASAIVDTVEPDPVIKTHHTIFDFDTTAADTLYPDIKPPMP